MVYEGFGYIGKIIFIVGLGVMLVYYVFGWIKVVLYKDVKVNLEKLEKRKEIVMMLMFILEEVFLKLSKVKVFIILVVRDEFY